jgi:hypothetical protein
MIDRPVTLTGVVAEHVAACNDFDLEAIMATFAEDALVNDARREFRGTAQIRQWAARELVGDRVTIEPVQYFEHAGLAVLRGSYDGNFDRSALPDDLILTNYMTVIDDRIAALLVIRNQETAP